MRAERRNARKRRPIPGFENLRGFAKDSVFYGASTLRIMPAPRAEPPQVVDVVIVGAGHNALVAGAFLARAGRRVLMFEAQPVIGGACRTEFPFQRAPGVGCSTGAYLLGPMPPEVFEAAGLRGRVQMLPRKPHGYLLNDQGEPVAFGVKGGDVNLSAHDRSAMSALDEWLAMVRDDLSRVWMTDGATHAEALAAVRDAPAPAPLHGSVRDIYARLVRGSVADLLEPLGFQDESLKATIATDGLVGSRRGYDQSGTGNNFLVHNMLRLPPGDGAWEAPALGAWQLVHGGMGSITHALADIIREHAGVIRTATPVRRVHAGPTGPSVELHSGEVIAAHRVIIAVDPRAAARLLSPTNSAIPQSPAWPLEDLRGTSLKVNLALSRLPAVRGCDRLPCLAGTPGPLAGTVHVLPERTPIFCLERARRAAVERAELPDPFECMIDVYTHTAVDPSLCDDHIRHAMSLFVQWVPTALSDADAETFARALIEGPVARLMPDLPGLVEDWLVLSPRRIEQRFGITEGHIHHLDNAHAFEHRRPRLPEHLTHPGVILCGASAHPGGSVIGVSGFHAAKAALA